MSKKSKAQLFTSKATPAEQAKLNVVLREKAHKMDDSRKYKHARSQNIVQDLRRVRR